jgi:hypothetical protein
VESQTIGECWIGNDLERSGCRRRRHILLLSSKGWRNCETSSNREGVPDETRTRNLLNTSPHPYRCSGYRQCLRPKLATDDGPAKAADNHTVLAKHHDMPQVQPNWTWKLSNWAQKWTPPWLPKTSEHSTAGNNLCQQQHPSILPGVFCQWLARNQCLPYTCISQLYH